jgi:hypothetical protein
MIVRGGFYAYPRRFDVVVMYDVDAPCVAIGLRYTQNTNGNTSLGNKRYLRLCPMKLGELP